MTELAGRYDLRDEIARGGMASVHLAVDKVLKRPVAVKLLDLERSHDYAYRDAVRREALSGARLAHPNVARIYDYGETERNGRFLPFVVMEYVPGHALSARLSAEGPTPWCQAAQVCADVARALAVAHDRNVVHRDVKPGNIILSPSGAKVVDFGLSAPVGENVIDDEGRIWGTAAYFAPEQLRGAPAGPAADVYALGLVLHACLTGRPAWTGSTIDQMLLARRLSPVPYLPSGSTLPEPLLAVHRRCLSPQPRKRPTARRVAQLLREVATGRSPEHRPRGTWGPLRKRPSR
jgi:serine/threonine-protein kinase